MADETDNPTGELTPPAPKRYVVAVEKPKDDHLNRSALTYDALNWRGNKGDVLPDDLVAALSAKIAYVGDPVSALEQWLSIGWIKEA